MADRTAAVLGLGRTGRSACRALTASGARVWAWDDDPARGAVVAERFSPVLRRRPQVLAVPWLAATLVIALLPTPATGAVGLPYFCSIPVG